jgi:two-component sensor histidine kinase
MIINTIHNEREISINFNCEQVQLNVNQAIPSSLIVNEIITNSIKHAFTGSKDGVINVELKEVNELIKIKLTDNGKGFPKNLDKKEKSSLGLQLIDVLSKQMNATYNYDSTPGGGTAFAIEFEKSAVKGIGNAYLV